MSVHALAFLACRLMAYWFVLTAIISLPQAISMMVMMEQTFSSDDSARTLMHKLQIYLPLFQAGTEFLAGSILFLKAGKLAPILVGRQDLPTAPITHGSLYRLGLLLVGLLVGLTWIPSLLEKCYVWLNTTETLRGEGRTQFIASVLGSLMAIGLIIWSIRNGLRERKNDS